MLTKTKIYRLYLSKCIVMNDLRKFAQQAISESWEQVAKKEGIPYDQYVQRVKVTSDYKILSQLSRQVGSFKTFGGVPLTGFQRKTLAAMADQRMKALGYANPY